jgi:glucan phosphoethanolaminetransferase (alkaline phosphatase superfamily)
MEVAVLIISLWLVVYGVFLVLYTQETRNFSKKFFPIKRLKIMAVIPLILGCILAIGAFHPAGTIWLLLILGLLSIAKGFYWIFGPEDQIKRILDWWHYRAEERTIRLWGLISLILGIAVLTYVI